MAKIRRLSDFERFVRRAVEGSIDRLLLQENDLLLIARQLISTADSSEVKGIAANDYLIKMGPGILDKIGDNKNEVAEELKQLLEGYLLERGRSMREPIKIELIQESSLQPNDFIIESNHLESEHESTRRYPRSGAKNLRELLSEQRAYLIIGGKRHLPINKAVLTIGRHLDNDIVIESSSVSRHHAQVKWRYGQFILHDLSSRTGTRINGHLVSDSILKPGDVIEAENTKLIFGEGSDLGKGRNVLPGERGDTKPLPPINAE